MTRFDKLKGYSKEGTQSSADNFNQSKYKHSYSTEIEKLHRTKLINKFASVEQDITKSRPHFIHGKTFNGRDR